MLSFPEPTLNFGFQFRPGIAKIQTMLGLLLLYINSKIPSIPKLYSTQLSLWFFFLNCSRAWNPKLGLHIKLMCLLCFPMLTFFYLDCLNITEFSVSWAAILPTESVLMRNIGVSNINIVCSSAADASKSLQTAVEFHQEKRNFWPALGDRNSTTRGKRKLLLYWLFQIVYNYLYFLPKLGRS